MNNSAVEFYQKGNIEKALEIFGHAFTIMPKNAAIALNLLQAIATKTSEAGPSESTKPVLKKCIKTIENSTLNEEQEERYHKVRNALDGIV